MQDIPKGGQVENLLPDVDNEVLKNAMEKLMNSPEWGLFKRLILEVDVETAIEELKTQRNVGTIVRLQERIAILEGIATMPQSIIEIIVNPHDEEVIGDVYEQVKDAKS